jgi:hypothetical protein
MPPSNRSFHDDHESSPPKNNGEDNKNNNVLALLEDSTGVLCRITPTSSMEDETTNQEMVSRGSSAPETQEFLETRKSRVRTSENDHNAQKNASSSSAAAAARWGAFIKHLQSGWRCDTCFIRNKEEIPTCLACEMPRSCSTDHTDEEGGEPEDLAVAVVTKNQEEEATVRRSVKKGRSKKKRRVRRGAKMMCRPSTPSRRTVLPPAPARLLDGTSSSSRANSGAGNVVFAASATKRRLGHVLPVKIFAKRSIESGIGTRTILFLQHAGVVRRLIFIGHRR